MKDKGKNGCNCLLHNILLSSDLFCVYLLRVFDNVKKLNIYKYKRYI